MKKQRLLILLLLPLLAHCSSSSSNPTTLPILASPARAQAWGAPQVVKNTNGYTSTYLNPANPTEKIRIIGSSKMMPFLVYPPNIKGTKIVNGIATQATEPQLWSKALIQGTTVKMYQATFPTAEKAAEFRTLGATIKDQSGGIGHYRVEVEGRKKQATTWLTELRFGQ